MSKDIRKLENKLFEKWKKFVDDDGFCIDGLIMNKAKNEVEILEGSKRKVLFFMKEPNNNSGGDYRYWDLEGETKSTFFRFLYSWLNGLTNIKSDDTEFPLVTSTFPTDKALVVVNAKKVSGGSVANDNLVWKDAKRDAKYLRHQIEIYKPNIIVCGGGYTCKTKEVLMQHIITNLIFKKCERFEGFEEFEEFNDIKFTQMEGSNWIWYSKEEKIVLINSYHPVAPKTNHEKYDVMLEHFQRFLKLNIFDI